VVPEVGQATRTNLVTLIFFSSNTLLIFFAVSNSSFLSSVSKTFKSISENALWLSIKLRERISPTRPPLE